MDLRLRKNKKYNGKRVNQQINNFKEELMEKRDECKKDTSDEEDSRTSVTQGDTTLTKEDNNVFENKSINQLILFFSIPAILSLMLESVATMIDTVFAGHLGEISRDALSAMGILSPVLSLLIAAQLIFGVSTGIIIAKRLGEKDEEKINNTFKVGLYSTLIFSTFISILIFLCKEQLLNILGASGEVRFLARQYLDLAVIFNVFSSVGYTLVNMIRSFGYPKMEIVIVTLSTLINIFFNVLFTFVFEMGISGIGLATLVSEMSYALFAVLFLKKKDLWMRKAVLDIREVKLILVSLIKIGFVQFLMQGLNSLNGFTVNKILLNYGEVVYLGAFAVCNSIYSMMLLPLIGFTEGIQSVIAYYQGSHDDKKKKVVMSKTLKLSLTYSLITTTLVYIFSAHITKLFTLDVNIIKVSISITKIMLIGFPFMGIIYNFIAFMQISGQEENASKLEMVRQVVLFIPLCFILPVLFSKTNFMNIKPELGVFFAMPISNIISLFFYTGRRIK